jgi:hypothetical protein
VRAVYRSFLPLSTRSPSYRWIRSCRWIYSKQYSKVHKQVASRSMRPCATQCTSTLRVFSRRRRRSAAYAGYAGCTACKAYCAAQGYRRCNKRRRLVPRGRHRSCEWSTLIGLQCRHRLGATKHEALETGKVKGPWWVLGTWDLTNFEMACPWLCWFELQLHGLGRLLFDSCLLPGGGPR